MFPKTNIQENYDHYHETENLSDDDPLLDIYSLEKQIQDLQQKLSGSPISGGVTEPSQKIAELETKQQELEKMLDDKDDQIEELI